MAEFMSSETGRGTKSNKVRVLSVKLLVRRRPTPSCPYTHVGSVPRILIEVERHLHPNFNQVKIIHYSKS